VFRSSITGKPIERASAKDLEALLRYEHPELDIERELERLAEAEFDRFEMYRSLLLPLEKVKQSRKLHPEGDALYHSLQVFELARDCRGYDEEFLLAALLHDVGKAIDPSDHVEAGLGALEGLISERTRFLIEHHMEALAVVDGTIGHRALRRLRDSPDFEDLMLLRELDSAGRKPGARVCTVDEAVEFVRGLAEDGSGPE
jgi:predicted HD phosphohydrolase